MFPGSIYGPLPYFMEEYGNPNGKFYDLAENAKKAVMSARSRIAKLFNCDEKEIIFNSGATEGNNTIIKGLYNFYNEHNVKIHAQEPLKLLLQTIL